MSLYNALFGVNNFAAVYLKMLGIDQGQIPRLRDVYPGTYNDEPCLVIYTRTGGGNRDYYDHRDNHDDPDYQGPFNSDIRAVDGYLAEKDDEFDNTYASFYFKVPDSQQVIVDFLASLADNRDPAEKWAEVIKNMDDDNMEGPEMARAKAVCDDIAKQLGEVVLSSGKDDG